MRFRSMRIMAPALAAAAAVVAVPAALTHGGTSDPDVVHACVNAAGEVRIVAAAGACPTIGGPWNARHWSIAGPEGPAGPPGPPGPASDRAVIPGFGERNVDNGRTNYQLARPTGDGEAFLPVLLTGTGSVVGLTVSCSASRTAGTAAFSVWLDGVSTGFGVTLDGTVTNYAYAVQSSGDDTFTAGQRLDVRYTTSSGWAPDTTDCEATVTVEYG